MRLIIAHPKSTQGLLLWVDFLFFRFILARQRQKNPSILRDYKLPLLSIGYYAHIKQYSTIHLLSFARNLVENHNLLCYYGVVPIVYYTTKMKNHQEGYK